MFEAFLLTSCIGTVLAALIMLFKPLTERIFPRSWHYYIWVSVLLVMLLPIKITPPAAVERVTVNASEARSRSELKKKAYNVYDGGKSIDADALWIGVAALLFAVRVSGYILLVRRIRRTAAEVEAGQEIAVLKSEAVTAPMMYGIIKPAIVLPEVDLTSEQLGNIFAHEMMHLLRRDVALKWLALAVKCMHWFNPAVYFICRCMSEECEISCDTAVVDKMSTAQKQSYADTILALVGKSRTQPLTTEMGGGKGLLKKRFAAIKSGRSTGRLQRLAAAVTAAAALLGAVFVSGAFAGGFFCGGDVLEYDFGEKMSADRLIGDTARAAAEGTVDLEREYMLFDYSFDSRTDCKISVKPDAEGKITVFFDTDSPAVAAEIKLIAPKGEISGYQIPADSSRAYCFDCGDKKEYLLEISGYCPGNYGINGKILIY